MYGWHFLADDCKLGHGDRRVIASGETYGVSRKYPLRLCKYGLHGSKQIIDALHYAPGPIICRIELIGPMLHGTDKSVAYQRRVLWMLDATDALRRFARLCALDVVHLWDAPEVVIQYLTTGDDNIRAAAWDAARDTYPAAAARDAAMAAAWDATWDTARAAARAAAWDAARAAAWDTAMVAAWDTARAAAWDTAMVAAWDTAMVAARDAARDAARATYPAAAARAAAMAAAWDAARAATMAAAWDAQNRRLTAMVIEAYKTNKKAGQ